MEKVEKHTVKERYKDQLSPAVYAKKQIGDMLISFGSLFAGAFLGNMLGTTLDKAGAKSTGKLPFEAERYLPTQIHGVGMMVGAFVGMITGGIIQGFSRWKKHEAERIAVAEINEDVANMKIRNRTDPELLRENARLREMLEQEEQKTAAAKIVAEGARPLGESRTEQTERTVG